VSVNSADELPVRTADVALRGRRRRPQLSFSEELGPSTYSLPLPVAPRLTIPSIAKRLVTAVSTSGQRANGMTRTGDAGCADGSRIGHLVIGTT